MLNIHLNEQYIVDTEGRRVAVILDMEVYRKLLAAVEDAEETALFDSALAEVEEAVPFEQAVAEIERDSRPE